jgi:hypothetical protein
MKRSKILTLLVTLLSCFTMLAAQTASASLDGARRAASDLFKKLSRDLNLNVRDTYTRGLLRRGQSTTVRTTLHSGNEYYLVAGGCEDAYDVDIAVFDENGNLISQDEDEESVAVARVMPKWTGTFFVKVTMYNSTADGAHFVLQYAWR